MKKSILLAIFASGLFCQTAPLVDILHITPRVYVLSNAHVHTEPGKSIPQASIVIRDGIIGEVGSKIAVPADATVLDMGGAHIYSGFIDGWVEVKTEAVQRTSRSHWNDLVHPEWVASDYYTYDEGKVDDLHSQGFTQIHVVPDDGIFRGQSSIIDLNAKASITSPIVSQIMDYKIRERGSSEYPRALLGTIAVMRQTLYDSEWYAESHAIYAKYPDKNEPITENVSLDVLGKARADKAPFFIRTEHETAASRAIAYAREFELKLWLLGSGYEYRRLSDIAKANPFIVLPLNYPGKPDISNPQRALQYRIEQLKHWDMAPDNAQKLVKSGLSIAFTTEGLKSPKQFRKNLILSVQRGLDEDAALAALTTTPAKRFGLSKTHGKIETGYHANLVVVDGSYFDESNAIKSVWVKGNKYDIEPGSGLLLPGEWNFSMNGMSGLLKLKGKPSKLSGALTIDTSVIDIKNLNVDGNQMTWTAKLDAEDFPGITRYSGKVENDTMLGFATNSHGDKFPFEGTNFKAAEANKIIKASASNLSVVYPEGAYGFGNTPDQPHSILIDNATIWTSGPQGILKDWDMLIIDGKISKIARDIKIPANNDVLIDGRGKFITAGIIDAHSHTAAASINESAQSVTSEVRIKDVLVPDDISIYRQLAGGTTTINVLHGSGNAIGGHNAVIKLRWGSNAQGLLLEGAAPGIKFALGENVKYDRYFKRYPQTRMGVEQIIRDAFTRARDYDQNLKSYAKKSRWRKTLIPPRKDLELDALVEVLDGKRLVNAHAYQQDEILMLLRVAEDFDFRVAKFEHVLEGYKVAERLAEHGAGGSSFADWWAYKFETYDGIPYNGALMHEAGVLVSFNSDDDEIARRLNLEAAKGVKYGGMSEIDALNMVTINSAKQLKIDKWVGSLEEGKDADFVVWSGHPLSTQSICAETWIDGRQYFSLQKDAELRTRDRLIRQDLIQKILDSEDDGNIAPEAPAPLSTNKDIIKCLWEDDMLREGGLK
ncbi:MAG: amidohydrolase family protein [Candidatus Marinimicrobia bacterium]|nr:amidohydrolase family protein [Candidatus Neomarinimicrobiota bacterium]